MSKGGKYVNNILNANEKVQGSLWTTQSTRTCQDRFLVLLNDNPTFCWHT